MDEEIQKRNTDCVYFLASPLTCKKGIECEYRHSEIARLNPRDCWYWMSGSCLNPTCGFRHPPLEKNAETPSEPTPVSPANKNSVPCYFFFNGFCKKGDRCLFSHAPDGNTSIAKTFKAASAVTDAVNKMVQDNGIVSLQKTVTVQHSEKAPKAEIDRKLEFNEDGQQRAPKTITERVPFPLIVATQHEEAGVSMLNSLHLENGLPSLGSYVPDQSFEEQVEDQVEPDDRLESSPGFDVLVNDRSENLVYDDDDEYLVGLERKQMDPNNGFLGYDCENEGEYEPQELVYESNMYDSFDFDDSLHAVNEVGNDFGCLEDRLFDSFTSRKRKHISSVAQGVLDLRDHLNKRRTIDCHPSDESSRKRVFFWQNGQKCPERHRSRPLSQRIHRRSSSEVRVNTSEPLGDLSSFRRHYNGRRHRLSSEIQRKQFPRDKESNEASAVFAGPKSLAQIKEAKKAAEENGAFAYNNSIRMLSVDFEGPKPLTEILKDKRRLDTWTEYSNSESN